MDVTEANATEANAASIHKAFQAMHNDLTRREAELMAELEARTETRKKRALEHKGEEEEERTAGKKQRCLTVETWCSLSTLPSGALSKVCALEEHIRVVSVPAPQNICIKHATRSSLSLCWDPVSGETEDVQVAYRLLSDKQTNRPKKLQTLHACFVDLHLAQDMKCVSGQAAAGRGAHGAKQRRHKLPVGQWRQGTQERVEGVPD